MSATFSSATPAFLSAERMIGPRRDEATSWTVAGSPLKRRDERRLVGEMPGRDDDVRVLAGRGELREIVRDGADPEAARRADPHDGGRDRALAQHDQLAAPALRLEVDLERRAARVVRQVDERGLAGASAAAAAAPTSRSSLAENTASPPRRAPEPS